MQRLRHLLPAAVGALAVAAALAVATAASAETVRLNWVEKLDTWRLTMTVPLLNAAREVLFLVAGAEKTPVLHAIAASQAAGKPDRSEHPVLCIQPTDGTLSWLLDRAAAAS